MNVTSTVPAVYAAFYSLVETAALAQDPPVDVMVAALEQYEPGAYVLIRAVENHLYEPRTLDYESFTEDYDLVGEATLVQGDIDPIGISTACWALYQAVVQGVVVSNAGMAGNGVLGVPAADGGPNSIIPGYARYTATPGMFGGGQGGFQATIEWSYHVQGYLTRA